ncbi:hypothetical protein LPB67_06895 [Undibacterium sp. Jales W-56]|uniref:hypothetical protein n=1 Tax=Undibacterium sp. Jales W-56 TaxID=2897325 RepID=UPI0021D33026|nr:hypothetical protein [Undibacterium sp. Jales W-56]MCU6433507.1 hypothetical protein [Undibacterium sp. Jales W-56]
MNTMKKMSFFALAAGLILALAACGGFVYTTVGGTVTGLGSGTTSGGQLVLIDTAGYKQALTVDGPFSFKVASNADYNITVGSQPAQVNCTVANGSGHMSSDAAVTNISVKCVPKVPVTVTLSGLTAGAVTLYNNFNTNVNVDKLILSTNGAATFAFYIPSGQTYAVTVGAQPPAQTCTVQNGTGTVDNSNLTGANNVLVKCIASVPVAVTLTGLGSGKTVTIADNGTDLLYLSANGKFTFANSIVDGQTYAVTVTTQPAGQTCTVTGGAGTALLSNLTGASNIAINCVNN